MIVPNTLDVDLEADPDVITIPPEAVTLAGFRAWATSDAFPQRGRFSFIDGRIVIDLNRYCHTTHNSVVAEISCVVTKLNRGKANFGTHFPDHTLVTNENVGFSTEPDGSFATYESHTAGRARLVPLQRKPHECMEVTGGLDWILEVVSDSSVGKDTQCLRELYHRAKMLEYWLIDARGDEIDFQILNWTPTGYEPALNRGGYQRSNTFRRSFRLNRERDRIGLWSYRLRSKVWKTS